MMNDAIMNGGMGMGMSPIWMLVYVLVIVVPFWFIFGKAGFSKWLSLLMVIPVVNLLALYYLAFAQWPGRSKTIKPA